MIQKKINQQSAEKAILIGIVLPHQSVEQTEEYLDELAFLASTAGAITIEKFYQKMSKIDSKTYIGSGKLDEISVFIEKHGIELAIFDDELSGAQQHYIEKVLKCAVIDRNSLILDIFAQRARTAQAKVQVELAQYQYLLPRLKGFWSHLERQGGGIGTRGPGETEIETDRRIVKEKISLLKRQLEHIERQAFTQRQNRGELIRLSLLGYTNVGKSTLMNLLSKADVFAENKLFATLDTTTRKIAWEGTPFLLSDTVGFIRKLPHHLIESFKTTLHELEEADLLLHVVDVSHKNFEEHIEVVNNTLKDLKVFNKPCILVLNKIDLYKAQHFDAFLPEEVKTEILENLVKRFEDSYPDGCILFSAISKENLDQLKLILIEHIRALYQKRYPYKNIFY
ncbi:MAG: GTPase HflX [Alphaproteobacteria bacterium]|nr:GTPase HflX [Alphaproteobacteria bacterium]